MSVMITEIQKLLAVAAAHRKHADLITEIEKSKESLSTEEHFLVEFYINNLVESYALRQLGKIRRKLVSKCTPTTRYNKMLFEKICSVDMKLIPNSYVGKYVEGRLDESCNIYSYKCKYPPNVCSVITKSYGSEHQAFHDIKYHLVRDHSVAHLFPAIIKNPKRFKLYIEGLKENKSFLKPQLSGENDEGNLSLEADDSNSILNTIESGDFEHSYVLNPNQACNAIPSVREAGKRRNRRQYVKELEGRKFDLNKHLESSSYSVPPTIGSLPFPFIYNPYPLEACCIIELNSNGDPIDFKEPAIASPSNIVISTQSAENEISNRKRKWVPEVIAPRPVLECVENRVRCKSNTSSEQKDLIGQEDNNENSENVEESIRRIAYRNIHMLNEQRKKRRYKNGPTAYICEICNNRFTANTSLTYHYMGHLKLKPYTCDVCQRSFTRRHSLKYHMMIHNNKTRFQCDTCHRLFRHPSHYKEHLRKHTGEEPFSCKFCSNKFKTRNSYKRHLKMQHQKLLTSNGIVPICTDS